jgi:hypothetical protein
MVGIVFKYTFSGIFPFQDPQVFLRRKVCGSVILSVGLRCLALRRLSIAGGHKPQERTTSKSNSSQRKQHDNILLILVCDRALRELDDESDIVSKRHKQRHGHCADRKVKVVFAALRELTHFHAVSDYPGEHDQHQLEATAGGDRTHNKHDLVAFREAAEFGREIGT